MKKLLVLLFSLLISFNSFGEWREITVGNRSGNVHYIDDNRIRENNGYVYWWELLDYLKPNKHGYYSDTVYKQGDCNLYKFKFLTMNFYKKPMGVGESLTLSPDPEWDYALPNSVAETKMDYVCDYVK